MIDGSGYPGGIKSKENIPVQARIMTIADIYDALSFSDRPYKKSIPLEGVIEILSDEGKKGKLDTDILDLFVKNKLYSL